MFTLQPTVPLLHSSRQGWKRGRSRLQLPRAFLQEEERRPALHPPDLSAQQLQPWEPTSWLKHAPQIPLNRVVSECTEIIDRNVVNGQFSRSIPMLIVVIQQLCFTPLSVCCWFVREPSVGSAGQINVSAFPILQILKKRQRVEITCLKSTEWIGNWTTCRNYTGLILCFQWLASTSFHLIYCYN